MIDFRQVLARGVANWKDGNADAAADEADCFRGSNTPLLFGGGFAADSSSHCPRIAMMRRAKLPTSYPKTLKDLLSHAYGRAMEATIKELVGFAAVEGLQTEEEEGYKALVTDGDGNIIYSARPDLIMFMNSALEAAVEMKSIQSNSTAEAIYMGHEPKLGAGIQCAAQMHFHDIPHGFIVYIGGHWVDGWSFTRKAKFKYEPDVTVFNCEFSDNGQFMVEGKSTIINRHGIESGIAFLDAAWREGEIPAERPASLKLFGKAAYPVCEYCIYSKRYSGVCDRAEGMHEGLKLENFMDIVRESLPVQK